jgi:hypothetical protein
MVLISLVLISFNNAKIVGSSNIVLLHLGILPVFDCRSNFVHIYIYIYIPIHQKCSYGISGQRWKTMKNQLSISSPL